MAFTGVGRGAGGIEPRAMPSSEPPYGDGAEAATEAGRDGTDWGGALTGGLAGALPGIGREAPRMIGRGDGVLASAYASPRREPVRCSAGR